jgi:hypothetical protein
MRRLIENDEHHGAEH